MVEVVDRLLGETILDHARGTGGFLLKPRNQNGYSSSCLGVEPERKGVLHYEKVFSSHNFIGCYRGWHMLYHFLPRFIM